MRCSRKFGPTPLQSISPVIILTAARLDPSEIQSGLNMGADDYVTKPFDHKELLARIHTKLRVKTGRGYDPPPKP